MDSWSSFAAALASVKYNFLCYIISFVVLGIMWFGHRVMFEYIGRSNRYFIFLGVLFYLVVCLIPFSTRLLAEHPLKWCHPHLCNKSQHLQHHTLYTMELRTQASCIAGATSNRWGKRYSQLFIPHLPCRVCHCHCLRILYPDREYFHFRHHSFNLYPSKQNR